MQNVHIASCPNLAILEIFLQQSFFYINSSYLSQVPSHKTKMIIMSILEPIFL